jgi:hypothetical protein
MPTVDTDRVASSVAPTFSLNCIRRYEVVFVRGLLNVRFVSCQQHLNFHLMYNQPGCLLAHHAPASTLPLIGNSLDLLSLDSSHISWFSVSVLAVYLALIQFSYYIPFLRDRTGQHNEYIQERSLLLLQLYLAHLHLRHHALTQLNHQPLGPSRAPLHRLPRYCLVPMIWRHHDNPILHMHHCLYLRLYD